MMRIAVIGAGGVGGYYGGLLARSGEDVTFIARGEHLKAIQANGLRIDSDTYDSFTIHPAQATDNPASVGPVDCVIIATKAHHLEQAAETARPLLGSDTAILPLQNGMDASERLMAVMGEGAVLGGVTWILSHIASPGMIEQEGTNRRIALGELDGRITPRAQAIADALKRAGVDVDLSTEINKTRWVKFIVLAAFSGVASVTRSTRGEIYAEPRARQMLEDAMREIEMLARASAVDIDTEMVPRGMAGLEATPPGSVPSMQRDILTGLPSELEAQTGYIVKRGEELGVPTPVNAFMYAALLPQEQRALAVK